MPDNKLPLVNCPLKVQGLMSNPSFVSKAIEIPGFVTDLYRQNPQLVKCDRDKCAIYSRRVVYDEEEDENGEVKTTSRVIEGCAIGLIPAEIAAATEDVTEAVAELQETAQTAGLFAIGALKLAASKYGLVEEFNKLAEEAGLAEQAEEQEEDGEEEPEEQEAEEALEQ